MMRQQPEESIWGTINSCIEIALNIYMIVAVDEKGHEHNGIMARADKGVNSLSEKARGLAEKDGDWLYFDEHTKDAALYEVLQSRVQACKKMEESALKEMKEIEKGNKILLPEYFGECPVPQVTGESGQAEPVCNGVFLVKEGESVRLAVHESVVEHYLTPMAATFGAAADEYHYYAQDHLAIPVHELSPVFKEVEQLVIAPDSLYATLNQCFGDYVKTFNEMVPEAQKIPKTQAPADLFLALQLEQVPESTEEAEMESYGEEVDYGIEL